MAEFDMVMDAREKISLRLRELYQKNGFTRYRMSKFEEYDLYSRNKDFLMSENVITFNDVSGRLLALKPDVTLSIVKNGKDCGDGIQKVYYHENVYRVASPEEGFREMDQVGIECMGRIDGSVIREVLGLAAESLETLGRKYVLAVSQLEILRKVVENLSTDRGATEELLTCAREKNTHGIEEICRKYGLDEQGGQRLIRLIRMDGPAKDKMDEVRALSKEIGMEGAADELNDALSDLNTDSVWIDFSATGNLRYYNGIAFQGFLDGAPGSVLSGGQYDGLMRRMGRKDRAIGFAVFLNQLERLPEEGCGNA